MIPDRLPWRHRARPSATLHEIQVRSAIKLKNGLVLMMLQKGGGGVKGEIHRTESLASGATLGALRKNLISPRPVAFRARFLKKSAAVSTTPTFSATATAIHRFRETLSSFASR
jgi:hypothetical protein